MTQIKVYEDQAIVGDTVTILAPDNVEIDSMIDKRPKIKLLCSFHVTEIPSLTRFKNLFDTKLRMRLIKAIARNTYQYEFEFNECFDLDLRPIKIGNECWYNIEFNCLYYDITRRNTK